MKIHIDLDDEHEDLSIIIKAKEWTAELDELISFIKKQKTERLFGVDDDQTILLDPNDIDYVYSAQRKVYAALGEQHIEVRMKLYEIEQILLPHDFMRFSKSVIGNLHHIERFELSFNGNLCVYFQSGNKEFITRKYVAAIKERLMMGGQDGNEGNI